MILHHFLAELHLHMSSYHRTELSMASLREYGDEIFDYVTGNLLIR